MHFFLRVVFLLRFPLLGADFVIIVVSSPTARLCSTITLGLPPPPPSSQRFSISSLIRASAESLFFVLAGRSDLGSDDVNTTCHV